MSFKHRWEKVRERNWDVVRDAWVGVVPVFPNLGAAPDPGLEKLFAALTLDIPEIKDPPARMSDIPGIRSNALWEALFLFHKCSHTNLAAQRLAQQGMQSWCLFNAYHSAYLGARGIMALLGVALLNLNGRQVAIDLFPEPQKSAKKKNKSQSWVGPPFQEFLIIRLYPLEQRFLWQGFQRMLRVSVVGCWDASIKKELVGLSFDEITPPRNRFLYKAIFWPLDDLMIDAESAGMGLLIGTGLDAAEEGFLLRLSFCVYRLFEQMLQDLSEYSPVIKIQFEGSRSLATSEVPELERYRAFLAQVSESVEAIP